MNRSRKDADRTREQSERDAQRMFQLMEYVISPVAEHDPTISVSRETLPDGTTRITAVNLAAQKTPKAVQRQPQPQATRKWWQVWKRQD